MSDVEPYRDRRGMVTCAFCGEWLPSNAVDLTEQGPRCQPCSTRAVVAEHRSRAAARLRRVVVAYAGVCGAVLALFITALPLMFALPGFVVTGVALALCVLRLVANLRAALVKPVAVVALVLPLVLISWLAGSARVGVFVAALVAATVVVFPSMPEPGPSRLNEAPGVPGGVTVGQLMAVGQDFVENWQYVLTVACVLIVGLFCAVILYLGIDLRLHPPR